MPRWNESTTTNNANTDLTRTIITTAEAAISRGVRRDPKPWWTEDVEEAVRERDTLRARAIRDPNSGLEWREAEKRTREVIRRAKRESWRGFTSGLSLRSDVGKVWSTIHAIDGWAAPTRRVDATLQAGAKQLCRDLAKVDAFMRVYSAVSHLQP